MADYEEAEKVRIEEIKKAQDAITAAGEVVKELKAKKAEKPAIDEALAALNTAKETANKLAAAFYPPERLDLDRENFESLLTRRFFFCPSFSIYGGAKGFYDFGPPGCAIKTNMLNYWRQWFILEESMLEVDTATITPEAVLRQSGHVERFNDLMVKDLGTGKYYRADHVLEDAMDALIAAKGTSEEKKNEYRLVRGKADEYTPEELTAKLREYNIKGPESGNDISDAFPSNLMFSTNVGRGAGGLSYLRPETAQGIFVNFARLLEFNGGKIPFAGATIGLAYRNEISPRAALLRVREFTLAEIEHFVDPDDKSHPKFGNVADVKVKFLSQQRQELPVPIPQERTVAEALKEGLIQNETVGYFIGRTQLYLTAIGIKPDWLRFRQHRANEKAHYAQDCWDAEILTSYGWIESVGIADRACYDLSRHNEVSSTKMTAFQRFDQPQEIDQLVLVANASVVGKAFRQRAKILTAHLAELDEEQVKKLNDDITQGSGSAEVVVGEEKFTITSEMVSFKQEKKKVSGRNFIPSVIEPSFGIGRIMYGMLEHSFYARKEDARRTVVGLSPLIAPVKCSVLPLQQNPKFTPIVQQISSLLTNAGISTKVDDAGQTIGKRYARTDEIGIPFGVTVDFETLENPTVTLRERDSTLQIRIPIVDLAAFITRIVTNQTTWEESKSAYPSVEPVSQ